MKNPNNKILVAAVILLLIANIALVAFMVMGRNRSSSRKSRMDPSEMMAKELNMTEEQKKMHKQLKDEHFKNIKPYVDSFRAARTAFYSLIKDSTVSDSVINVYSQRLSERQSAIDKLNFFHFQKIRNLFSADQRPKYDEFVQKMMQRNRKDSSKKD